MDPRDFQDDLDAHITPKKNNHIQQSTSSGQTTLFKNAFFNLIKTQQSPKVIQQFMIKYRKMFSQKIFLHLVNLQPKLYEQYRYLLLGISLSFQKRQQYHQRWATFYQIINQILKIPIQNRKITHIQTHVLNFSLFLLQNNQCFFEDFPDSLAILKTSTFQLNLNKKQQQNTLSVKKLIRIFNSLLCLKSVTIQQYLLVIYNLSTKAQNYTEFLLTIQDKFIKRMKQYQTQNSIQSLKQSNQISTFLILDPIRIYIILHIFYDLDPQDRLRSLIKTLIKQQQLKNIPNYVDSISSRTSLARKSIKNKITYYGNMMKFLIKQIIKNRNIEVGIKKQFLIQCFNQIKQIQQDLFEYLLQQQASQQSQIISDVMMKYVQKQSLRFITVSRLKSILKRINLCKTLNYTTNIKKMFKILRLLIWVSKKFNQSHPSYQLDLNSSLKISHIRKAQMIIFSIDFREPQVGRIIQFQINKHLYDILIKYTQSEQSCGIQVITQVDGQQKLKQKKQINKWSYILCMVGLCEKKEVGIFIDGAYFKIMLEDSASQITQVQFGPFSGALKDVYILDKVYEMCQLHKKYFHKCRKMDLLLQQLGEKQFIFTFDRGKTTEKTKWFWRKQMTVQYKHIKKLRSISFGQGIQQLGGFPALLFLITKIISQQKCEEQQTFLIDFFQFLNLLVNQCQVRQALRWMHNTNSTMYFGQFFWLILNKNIYLRSQKTLFNRIINFFSWFFKLQSNQNTLNLKYSIIQDIYLNFQIWSKCNFQIKMLVLNQLQTRFSDMQILLQMVNRQGYDKIISSIVFFFSQEGPENNSQVRTISKIPVSQVHQKLSNIGSKFCQLYINGKIQYSTDLLKKDINTIMGLITTFFYKKHLYFSKGELSSLTILLDHFRKNFVTFQILQKTSQYQIFIVNQLSILIANCPSQCQAIFAMFELGLALLSQIDNYKNATALMIDGVTLNDKRSSDSLQFSFKLAMYIIKNSVIIYEPNSIYSQQQILSVLLGSLRKKANQSQQKLKYMKVFQQFKTFNIIRLKKLLSLTQFCMVLKQCVQEKHQLATNILFLKIIMTNKLLSEVASLGMNCIKTINQIIKNKYSNFFQQFSMQKCQQKQKPINISQVTGTNHDQSKIQYPKMSQQNGIQQQKIQQKVDQKTLSNLQNIVGQQNKLNIQSLSQLQQIFIQNDLQSLYKCCRCPQFIELLLNVGNLNLNTNCFQLPLNQASWINCNKNYGNDLGIVLKTPLLTTKQLQILVIYLKNKKNDKNNKQNLSMEKNILVQIVPLYIIYCCLAKINTETDKYSNSNQLTEYLKIGFTHLKSREVITMWHSIKFNKKYIDNFQKKQELDVQKKRLQLLDISRKILSQYQANLVNQIPIQNQLNQLKGKLQKQRWSIKYLFENAKSMKKINEELKQIITGFQQLIQLFSKNNNANADKQESPTSVRKKAESSARKKKVLQIPDIKQRERYSQQLKNIIKSLCSKMQRQSKKKQQLWNALIDKNIFWGSSKIKNNQCYEIHPKITGFYKLNIVKTAFEQVPYPRRKSFEHELEQQNQNDDKIEQKLPSNQIIKTFLKPEIVQSTDSIKKRRKSQNNIETASTVPLSQVQIPKQFFYAQHVTQKGVYAGIMFYNQNDHSIIFKSRGYDSLPKQSIVYQLSTIFHRIQDKQFKIRILLNNKSQIFARRYIHRHTAIQIFSFHKTYFFNLFFEQNKLKFFKSYSNRVICIADPRDEFERRKYTQRWLHGKLDNFQYLMLVNIYSGRTTNDLAQYPVMPWVITNYQSKQIEINKQFMKDPNNIRDLQKPSGKISQKKFINLKMRCNQIQFDDLDSKFLYGTMYSNPTVIYNFFIRLQPFTGLHWQHQGRRIDHADRLFSAVRDQFTTVLTSTSDNKQLVPQFYYWPQFLKNRNKVNLGIKQNKQQVHDVKLPGWARNPQQFIFKMRQVLQSPQITRKLHHWIDLIFGYKSSPRQIALQHDNLFHFRTYEHDIFQTQQSQQAIKGAQISISQFGQIPYPLFTKPHAQKNLIFFDHIKLDTYAILRKQAAKKIYSIQLKDQGFFLSYQGDVQFFQSQNTKSIDISLQKNARAYKSIGSSAKCYDFNNNNWFTLKDGVFRIFDKKSCMLESDLQMECYSFIGRHIFYGYRSQLIVAKIQNNYRLTKINSFYGHKNTIYRIQVSILLDIIVSIDEDGLVLIHQFQKQRLLRQFDLGTKQQITNLCIHQMGYFIFLTKDQKLIIFTFLGQLFLNQDIGITNRAIVQFITKVVIFQQNKSQLLVSTDKGNIYMIDFLQIKRFNDNSIYKEFARFRTNILENCPRLGSISPIKDFIVKPVPGEQLLTYKVYILYQNNCVLCFYSAEQFQQKLKKNKMLGQLGLFDYSGKLKDKQKDKIQKSKSKENHLLAE